MPVRTYSRKVVQCEAIQLVHDNETGVDNSREVAHWADGIRDRQVRDGETIVTVEINVHDVVNMNDWVVCNIDGSLRVLTDREFKDEFAAPMKNAPATCQYCLADPQYTALADPHQKKCPVCGSAYVGPRRSMEYQTLVNAGMVANDD